MDDPHTWMATHLPLCKMIDAMGFEKSGMPEPVQEWVRQNWVAVHANQQTVYHKPSIMNDPKNPEVTTTTDKNNPEVAIEQHATADPPPLRATHPITPKGLFEKNASGELIPNIGLKNIMDDANAKIVDVWREQGEKAAVEAMFTGEQGQRLSYSEMRMRYG